MHKELEVLNPFEAAQDVISRIAEVLVKCLLPPMITGANPIVMNANQQIVSGVGPNKLNQQIEKSNAIDSFIGK
jgi:hypothetical protein